MGLEVKGKKSRSWLDSRQGILGVAFVSMEIIKSTFPNSESLPISGFGKFSVIQKQARRGRNPKGVKSLILRGGGGGRWLG